ncbi:MAG: hypothetical protein U9Q76_01245, partial [candidate division WOR-3 bacterium]|nr:hypothetical protein [candidate division WOR-3 bacterium]
EGVMPNEESGFNQITSPPLVGGVDAKRRGKGKVRIEVGQDRMNGSYPLPLNPPPQGRGKSKEHSLRE